MRLSGFTVQKAAKSLARWNHLALTHLIVSLWHIVLLGITLVWHIIFLLATLHVVILIFELRHLILLR